MILSDPKNILVTTFGVTWAILPELIGFSNPGDFDLYMNHTLAHQIQKDRVNNHIDPIDELWVVHSDSTAAMQAIERFFEWKSIACPGRPAVKFFSYTGVSELADYKECRLMADLILRVVFHASKACKGGKLVISLTGGRKNMSADIQRASDIFGCHCLIHIADNIRTGSFLRNPSVHDLLFPPETYEIDQINPVVIFGYKESHPILDVEDPLKPDMFPLNEGTAIGNTKLIEVIDKRVSQQNSLIFNNYQHKVSLNRQTSFYGLQLLPPKIINALENSFVGDSHSAQEENLKWLKDIPKAELHCHIGGILNVSEMIEVAATLENELTQLKQKSVFFEKFLHEIGQAVSRRDDRFLGSIITNSKDRLRKFDGIPEPYAVAGFLSAFKGYEEYLDRLIFGDLTDTKNYCAIGINRYEQLGDLQGSGLLKSPATLAKTCQILVRQCAENNIAYCELRCSPANYVTPVFSIDDVIGTIYKELYGQTSTLFRLIIIGSRHNNPHYLKQHIELALNMTNNSRFADFFAGFDIAGDEEKCSPIGLKTHLAELLQRCIKMTIHAGEGVDVLNIWQAAYELYADRIGHGLTLQNNPLLLNKFIDRKITVEMCPSSNHQIIGFRRFVPFSDQKINIYPLKNYFDNGVRVTINTDNPGISRTSLPREYLMAAELTPGGLSKWDILKIVRNGFRGSFLSSEPKKELMLKVEKEIVQKLL